MKRILGAALALVMSLGAAPAFSQSGGLFSDYGIEVSGDASCFSQYVWRGILLDRDEVLQTGIYVSNEDKGFGKLSLKLWSSHQLENEDNLDSEENDYTIDYTYTLAGFGLSAGHTYYDFTGTNTHSREWYAGVTLPALAAPKEITLSPSLFVYRDYGKPAEGGGEGTYVVAGIGAGIPVTAGKYACSLDLAGHYGWNHELFIAGKGGDLYLQAAFTVPLTENLTISPNLNYSKPFGDLRKAGDGNQKARTYAGVTAKYVF